MICFIVLESLYLQHLKTKKYETDHYVVHGNSIAMYYLQQ